jgi:hypothetical protein
MNRSTSQMKRQRPQVEQIFPSMQANAPKCNGALAKSNQGTKKLETIVSGHVYHVIYVS